MKKATNFIEDQMMSSHSQFPVMLHSSHFGGTPV